jgi:hypothetical protein
MWHNHQLGELPMSYDLMVFDPAAAPATHTEFMAWYRARMEDENGLLGDDVSALDSSSLQGWFHDMIIIFPPMNVAFAGEEVPEDESLPTDYTIGNSLIYAMFAWSKAELAYNTVMELAKKHAVGVFDPSSPEAEVWLPQGAGLAMVYSASSGRL